MSAAAIDERGAARARDVERRLALFGGTANLIGASGVVVFLTYLAPNTLSDAQIEQVADLWPVFLAYMAFTLPLGWLFITRRPFRPIAAWLRSGEPADVAMQERVLRYPRNWALSAAVPWTGGAVIAFPLIAQIDVSVAAAGALGVVAGGLTSCSLQYLAIEWIMRPVTARALAGGPPPGSGAPGVATRTAMAWIFGSGVPLLGIIAFAAADIAGADFEAEEVAVSQPRARRPRDPERRGRDDDRGAVRRRPARLDAQRAGEGRARRAHDPGRGRRRQRGGPARGRIQPDDPGPRGA